MKKYYKVIYSTSEWFCHARYEGVIDAKKRPHNKTLVSTELEDVSEIYFDTEKEARDFVEYTEFKNKRLYP